MDDSRFDFVIIGGGQAAVPLARALVRAGRRAAVAERKHLGGSCINFGCTPTKAAIACTRVAHLARRGAEFGLHIPTVEVDLAAVLKRSRGIVEAWRTGLEAAFASPGSPILLKGHARLEGRGAEGFRVRVGDQLVTAAQVVLDTGTRSLIPPIPGLRRLTLSMPGIGSIGLSFRRAW
jgi:pyruvate/2-oxoglutarate dehydrogenase complex dihydrolipoamide dehydrogenase (E3) component